MKALVRCDRPGCESPRVFVVNTDHTVAKIVSETHRRPVFTCPCGGRCWATTDFPRSCCDCGAALSRWTAGPECNRCAEAQSEAWVQAARRRHQGDV